MDSYTNALLLVLVLIATSSAIDERCSRLLGTDVNVFIDSQRNETGHWILTVDAFRADPTSGAPQSSPAGVTVDVAHSSATFGAAQYTRLRATAVYESLPVDAQQLVESATTEVAPTETQTEKITTTSIPTERAIIPPSGYEHHDALNSYYKFHSATLSWDDARTICSIDGGHLIILNSQEEGTFLMDLWTKNKKDIKDGDVRHFVHVGVNDKAREGQWKTLLGERLEDAGYIQWKSGEPNGGHKENCMVAEAIEGPMMHDVSCARHQSYICEWCP